MVHYAGTVGRVNMNPDGTFTSREKPTVFVDFMLRVMPPEGSEIDLSKIRAFIIYLAGFFPIKKVTTDGYQSKDTAQLLSKAGFETSDKMSMDKTDKPSLGLKNALFERRVFMYEYEPFVTEILELERNVQSKKVDHPKKSPTTGLPGRKDVVDAVTGAAETCVTDLKATRRFDDSILKRLADEGSADPHPVGPLRVKPKQTVTQRRLVDRIGVSWGELAKNVG
jgi:hypothetical protein